METTHELDRELNPTVERLIEYATDDLSGVLERRFSGLTLTQASLGSSYSLSPRMALLLSAVLLAMAELYQLQSLMATSELRIGQQRLTNLSPLSIGYASVRELIEQLEVVATLDLITPD